MSLARIPSRPPCGRVFIMGRALKSRRIRSITGSRNGLQKGAIVTSNGEFPGPLRPEVVSAVAVPEPTATPGVAARSTYADVGARVARIITAAEEASAEIQADALAGADRIRAEARHGADRLVAERKLEGERIVAEAEEGSRGLERAAEAYATRCRVDAEEEAERVVSEAEAQAFELVQAAQREAKRVADESSIRLAELEQEARALEARRALVLDQLRDIASQLFQVDGKAA
jgi:hypothetical protein